MKSDALRRQLAFLLLILPTLAFAANPSPYPAVDYPVSFTDVRALPPAQGGTPQAYGPGPSQYGMLWLPRRPDAAPLVMLVHGGCWLSEYGLEHIQPLASSLARAGYAVWAPEYRRVGEDGGGWPGTLNDLRAALARAATFDRKRVDASRTIVAGHSAGGQLALWLAAQEQPLVEGLTLVAAVGLAAITDLAAYRETGNSCSTVVERFLGGDPETVPERYRSASPAQSEAGVTGVPVYLLHGTDDNTVPPAQSEAMPRAALERLEGAGHYDLIHPGTEAFPALLQILKDIVSS